MAAAVMTTTPLPSVLPLPLPARPGGEIGLGLGVGVGVGVGGATLVEGASSSSSTSHHYNIHHRSHSTCVGSSSSSPFTAPPENRQSRGRSSSSSRRTSSQGRTAADMTEEAINTERSSDNKTIMNSLKQINAVLPTTNMNNVKSNSPSIKGHRKRPSLQVYAGGSGQQQQHQQNANTSPKDSGNTSPQGSKVTSPGTYDYSSASNIAYKTSISTNRSSSSPSSSTPSSAASSRPGSGGNITVTTNTNNNNSNNTTTSHLRRTSSIVRAIDFAYPSHHGSSRSSSVSNSRAFVSRSSSSASAASASESNSNSSSRRESASSSNSASRISYASSSSPSSSVASQFRNCSLSMQPHFFDGAVFLDSDEEDEDEDGEDHVEDFNNHHGKGFSSDRYQHRQSRNYKHHLQQPNRNHYSNQQTTKSPRLQMQPAFSPTSSTASTLFSPMSSDFPPTPPTRSASESSATDSHVHTGAGAGTGSSGNIESVHPVKQRFPIASSDDESGLEAEASQHHGFGYYDGEVMKNQVDRIRESQLHSRRDSHCSAGSVDSDTITCFQPGCDMTISPGTYYCERHDDPFQDDP